MDRPRAFHEPYDSKLSRTSQAQKMQGLSSSMFHLSMLLRSRAKDKALERAT